MKRRRGPIDWKLIRQTLARQASLCAADEMAREDLDEVLRRRAERLKGRKPPTEKAAGAQNYLVCRIDQQRYAVVLSRVSQVFPRPQITPVPGSGDEIVGLAVLLGEVRSVVDPRRALCLDVGPREGGYVLLVRADELLVGLWVEGLEDVRELEADGWTETNGQEAATAKSIRGATSDQLFLLDLDRLLAGIAPASAIGQAPDARALPGA